MFFFQKKKNVVEGIPISLRKTHSHKFGALMLFNNKELTAPWACLKVLAVRTMRFGHAVSCLDMYTWSHGRRPRPGPQEMPCAFSSLAGPRGEEFACDIIVCLLIGGSPLW